ncbi:MAG TPA: aspartate carbamoyltransferase [Chloroflexi bacterium]|nr:aspartate carbamoyltransferase [Chloroflexota bacterium]|tara:strand:- start:2468 stop:3430 length:963 start_codon:yes stop_codon:yes gene_type:complete
MDRINVLPDEGISRFDGMDILSVKQFNHHDLDIIFDVAREMRRMVRKEGTSDVLKGKLLANLFYEPSTRTSSSFAAATQRLGGNVIQINNVTFSSVSKGEELRDTIRSMGSYSDAVVLRHPDEGSADIAAEVSEKPIINAGDGIGEHPTQALLDIFTIVEELGTIDGLTVTMLGDLKYGRTVHSLARLLALYDVKLHFVAPDLLKAPDALVDSLIESGVGPCKHVDLDSIISETDVLYVTRVQQERFVDKSLYDKVNRSYAVNVDTMDIAKERMIVMHPLPRVDEISRAVDEDPRAAYFRQMEYGMYVRMALLALVFGKV